VTKPFNLQHEACGNFVYVERTYCSVLHGMREIIATSFSDKALAQDRLGHYEVPVNVPLILSSLIEELQVYGSRMEAHLSDQRSFEQMKKEAKELKEEIEKLKKEKSEITGEPESKRRGGISEACLY